MDYPVILSPAEEGGYNVSFPDFPGCVTFGESVDDAKKQAKEVLELWIEELQDKNEDIPQHTGSPIVDQVQISFPD